MIRGRVTEALDPMIELGLKQGDTITVIPAVIDTGFSGMVCLAERYLEQIALSRVGGQRVTVRHFSNRPSQN